MLPTDWLGVQAYRLCRELYSHTCALTRRHLHSLPGLEVTDARGGRLRMSVEQRFGGLGV
jgi:phenylacetic acid degradation operon negative regulatory protein